MLNKCKTKLELIDKGILFMLLSALIATLSGAVAKVLSQTMDPIEIVFYRNLLGVIIILYSLKKIPVSINIANHNTCNILKI